MTSDGIYSVPNGCDTKNFRRPCGLGSTLTANNIVLMYPNVLQYLVSSELRRCDPTHTDFLSYCSSPSSALSKGMIRYLAFGVVIRSYRKGVRDQMISLALKMEYASCECLCAYMTVQFFGLSIGLCESCYDTSNIYVTCIHIGQYIALHYIIIHWIAAESLYLYAWEQ